MKKKFCLEDIENWIPLLIQKTCSNQKIVLCVGVTGGGVQLERELLQ
jgi:hypothetical protein